MKPLDFLILFSAIALIYTISGLAGKHLYWLLKGRHRRSHMVNGDMVGGNYSYRGDMATFNISGRSFRGQNITITNDRIVVDGKDVTDEYDIKPVGILEIKITEGVLGHLTTDANVSAGDIAGDVDAGGNVSCGNVGGDLDAGGNVSCGKVGGDVDAGGNVRHG